MKADRKNFEKTINGLGEYYLRELCMSMYDMIEEKTLRKNASDRINTESALAFRTMQKELEDTKKELEDCKKVIAKLNYSSS